MTVERMHNGFYAAGDVKITDVDKHTSELVGGQAGWVFDDALFVGGGGYWLANGSRDREMAYGGLVVQWQARPKERVGYGVKGLIGGGEATLAQTITFPNIFVDTREFGFDPRRMQTPMNDVIRNAALLIPTKLRFRENFFVAEPEATVSVKLLEHLKLTGGVGYRFVATGDRVDNRLRGATGSVGFQIS